MFVQHSQIGHRMLRTLGSECHWSLCRKPWTLWLKNLADGGLASRFCQLADVNRRPIGPPSGCVDQLMLGACSHSRARAKSE